MNKYLEEGLIKSGYIFYKSIINQSILQNQLSTMLFRPIPNTRFNKQKKLPKMFLKL